MIVRAGSTSVARRLAALAAAVLSIALVAGACSSEETAPDALVQETAPDPAVQETAPDPAAQEAAPAAAALPEGYELVEAAAVGVEVAVPSDWTEIDREVLDRVAQSGVPDVPLTPEMAQQLRLMVDQGSAFMMDPASMASSPNQFATNLTISRFQVRSASAAELVDEISQEFTQIPGLQDLTAEVTDSPAGEAVIATYTLQGPRGGKLDTTYLALPTGAGEAAALVLTTDQPDQYGRDLFDTIVGTLSLT